MGSFGRRRAAVCFAVCSGIAARLLSWFSRAASADGRATPTVTESSTDPRRENEAAFLEKLQEDIAKGTSWERVADLISLENSQSKTIRPTVAGSSDLTRMKEILLTLKREGDKAPGAAGF